MQLVPTAPAAPVTWVGLLGLVVSAGSFATVAVATPVDPELSALRDRARDWAPVCQGSASKDECDDGDWVDSMGWEFVWLIDMLGR